MQPQGKPVPVSRELVRIIRESSRLETPGLSLSDHLQAIDAFFAHVLDAK